MLRLRSASNLKYDLSPLFTRSTCSKKEPRWRQITLTNFLWSGGAADKRFSGSQETSHKGTKTSSTDSRGFNDCWVVLQVAKARRSRCAHRNGCHFTSCLNRISNSMGVHHKPAGFWLVRAQQCIDRKAALKIATAPQNALKSNPRKSQDCPLLSMTIPKYSKTSRVEDRKLANAFCMIRYLNFLLRHLFFPELHFVIHAFILLCIKVLKGMKKLTNYYF